MDGYAAVRGKLERGEAVVLDGGIGAELVRRGVRWRGHGMRTDSSTVQAVHEEFLDAGADVIRTNTFQLNRRLYLNVFRNAEHMRHIGAPGLEQRASELTRRAVELARAARERAGRDGVPIAGVMSPLEHCFRPDLAPADEEARPEHREIATLLAEAGVDLLLLESMNTIGEARVAATAAAETGLPVWVSFVVDSQGRVLSGESLVEANYAMRALGVDAVLVNCAPPEDISTALGALASSAAQAVGGYAHLGKFDPPSWKFEFHPQFNGTEAWPPERYASQALQWQRNGAAILGGCCGTTPDHVKSLKAALEEAR
jgi:S-methylmethionine-dependent homocysteine/selenocysteine methylase